MRSIIRNISNQLKGYTVYQLVKYKYPLLPKRFNETFEVPIDLIKLKVEESPAQLDSKKFAIGGVMGGDWDLKVWEFASDMEKNIKYKCLYDHYVRHIPWDKTFLFREYYTNEFNKGGTVRGCKDLKSLLYAYNKYDTILKSIQENGIKTGKIDYDVPVYIGRNGNYIFTFNGNHRFYMCLLLGIKSIPIKVYLRHELWYEKLERWKEIGEVPNEFKNHPDCSHVFNQKKFSNFNRINFWHLYFWEVLISGFLSF